MSGGSNADQVAASIRAAADDLAGGMPATYARVADAIAAAVRPPVLTGRLARSVRPVSDAHSATATAGGPGVAYAAVQEFGSPRRHIRGRHYLSTALDATTDQVVALIGAGIQDSLDKAGS